MPDIPPIVLYFLGVTLVVFGALRAWHLGWKRRESALLDDGTLSTRRRESQRHVAVGVLWVALGLFVIVSEYIETLR